LIIAVIYPTSAALKLKPDKNSDLNGTAEVMGSNPVQAGKTRPVVCTSLCVVVFTSGF